LGQSPMCGCFYRERSSGRSGCLSGFAHFVGQSPTKYWSHFGRYVTCVVNSPAPDGGRQGLARIQGLWTELQAARKDPVKYKAIAERLRREADIFLQTFEAARSVGGDDDTSEIPSDNAPYRTLTGAKVRGVRVAPKRKES
jgi:hypothetical protein